MEQVLKGRKQLLALGWVEIRKSSSGWGLDGVGFGPRQREPERRGMGKNYGVVQLEYRKQEGKVGWKARLKLP